MFKNIVRDMGSAFRVRNKRHLDAGSPPADNACPFTHAFFEQIPKEMDRDDIMVTGRHGDANYYKLKSDMKKILHHSRGVQALFFSEFGSMLRTRLSLISWRQGVQRRRCFL